MPFRRLPTILKDHSVLSRIRPSKSACQANTHRFRRSYPAYRARLPKGRCIDGISVLRRERTRIRSAELSDSGAKYTPIERFAPIRKTTSIGLCKRKIDRYCLKLRSIRAVRLRAKFSRMWYSRGDVCARTRRAY